MQPGPLLQQVFEGVVLAQFQDHVDIGLVLKVAQKLDDVGMVHLRVDFDLDLQLHCIALLPY